MYELSTRGQIWMVLSQLPVARKAWSLETSIDWTGSSWSVSNALQKTQSQPDSTAWSLPLLSSFPELTKFPFDNWNREYTQSLIHVLDRLLLFRRHPDGRSWWSHRWSRWRLGRLGGRATTMTLLFAPVGIDLVFLPSVWIMHLSTRTLLHL